MSADSLHYKSIIEISELIRRKEAKPSEVTEAMLGRIAKLDGQFHGYALVLAERAMAQAKQYDAEIAKGVWRGPLHGVPIGLKDLCYTSFAPTAGGDLATVLTAPPPRTGRRASTRRPPRGWSR